MNDEQRQKQIDRESDCIDAGYSKFVRDQERMQKESNGSNTMFAVWVKKHLLGDIAEEMRQCLNDLYNTRASLARTVIENCLLGGKSSGNWEKHGFWNLEEAAFMGFQLALDTALNPNFVDHKVASKHGGEKKLLAKKSIPELQAYIGKTLNQQIGLKIVKSLFPEWYRQTDINCQKKNKDGMRSTTSYWEYRMRKAIDLKIKQCDTDGDVIGSHMLRHRKLWSHEQELIIGAWILSAVCAASDCFIEQVKWIEGKSLKYLVLSEAAEDKRSELLDYARSYSMNLLPMLITPEPVSNLTLGGWLTDSLQEPETSFSGHIELSDRHLEFINRQSRVAFQINPFSYKLLKQLVDDELPLGKFHYQTLDNLPTVAQLLSLDQIGDKDEQDRLIRSHPDFKQAKRVVSDVKDRNLAKIEKSLMAYQVVDKAKHLLKDESFFIPMKFDFRGRIYSRVPFISFQSNDCGRYLIRFAEKTPIDDRTEYWFKVGIANAGGCDKQTWKQREQWFDSNRDAIINVGRMVDDGNFSDAYKFLKQESIDDPFCLAALANEYVKVFVDRTQDYTQCYVCVDASCSGTAIFNAWRRNRAGAEKVNLVNTEEVADIYMAVWKEIKANAKTFDAAFLERLESSKLLRKMMKTTYVPASYASPTNEQLMKLRRFNRQKLKPAGIEFNDKQLEELLSLWEKALDKVSSISTVVKWFQTRTKEALEAGASEIYYTSSNGSKMTLRYPKTKLKRIKLPSRGSALFSRTAVQDVIDETNNRKLITAVTSNVTHLTDAAALCETLWNWEGSFVGIHDAAGFPIGRHLDDAVTGLKQGFATATSYSVWDGFRDDNNLPKTDDTQGPVVGDLDIAEILDSNYLYS